MSAECEVCGRKAVGKMYWQDQPTLTLCRACINTARAMLQRHRAFYLVRPLRVAKPVSAADKAVLKKLDPVEFRTAVLIGVPENALRGMLDRGLVTMTKGGNALWFRRKEG